MIARKERTMDVYETVGAEMRLLKTLGEKTATDASMILSAADTDRMLNLLRRLDEICSRAEDNMFRDYPKLPSEYTGVFYGASDDPSEGEVNARMREKMKGIASSLVEREPHRKETR